MSAGTEVMSDPADKFMLIYPLSSLKTLSADDEGGITINVSKSCLQPFNHPGGVQLALAKWLGSNRFPE